MILGISKKDNISESFAEDLNCVLPNEESLSFVESKIFKCTYKRIFTDKTKVKRFLNILSQIIEQRLTLKSKILPLVRKIDMNRSSTLCVFKLLTTLTF